MKKTAIIFILSLSVIVTLLFSCGGGGGGASNAIDDTVFSIGYNANGAESGTAPSVQTGSGKEVLSVSNNTGSLAKAGYLFDGWNTSADGSGADYAPGALYNGKNITLYAKWAAIFNYHVLNFGSPAPSLDGAKMSPGIPTASITGLTSKGMTLSNITVPRTIDGYTVASIDDNAFQGCSNLTEVTISDTVTEIGDNAFNGCSNLSGITMQGTTPPAVGADAFAGCVMLAVIVPQSAVSSYNSSPGWSTVAILAPGTFSIVYNGNGSDGGVVPQRQVGMIGITIQVYGNNGSLTRAGCTFNGWNTKADGTGNSFAANASYAGPDNMTLYAQWTHPDYTVTFDGNGADTEASPSTIKVIAPANTIGSLPATPPKKNGYHFVGWYTQAGGTGDPFVVGYRVITDRTVYAKWSVNDYTISYDRNSATGGSVPESHATQFNQAITLRMNTGSLERTGYRFGGWNTKADGTGTDYEEGASYTVTGDATLYAKWLKLYTITYNSNGATGGSVPPAQEGINGEQITLQSNSGNLVWAEHWFDGWNTRVDGTGTTYVAGTSKYTLETSDVALYAKWSSHYIDKANLEVGDIVLQNGKYVACSSFSTHSSEYMVVSQPAGVICYKGETGAVGITGKVYMVGLDQGSSLQWAPNETTGSTTIFNTSDTAGEGNWAVIQTADLTGSENAASNYPAFNYANTYSVIGYTSGWFLPSWEELKKLGSNQTTINDSITIIINAGGIAKKLPLANRWSSSQSSYNNTYAYGFSTSSGYGSLHKRSGGVVLVVHALDD
ncbi:MAG: InlB B-repeat-containing protein [Spirochaetia bacterium]|nr:InlB B-repeat-containing protein [Spirochaetia bacterium]